MCSGIHADPDGDRVVIYRRSPKSITMRCNKCGLHWTMTRAKIHKAATTHKKVHPYYAMLANRGIEILSLPVQCSQ